MGAAFALSDHHPTHAQLFQPPAHRNHKATRNVTDGDGLSARKRSEDKIINSGHVFPASLLELRHITKGWLRVKGGRWLRAAGYIAPNMGKGRPRAVQLSWFRQREICIESAGSNPPASGVEVHSAPWPVLHFPGGGPTTKPKRREDDEAGPLSGCLG
jgi:hypothetical protein